MRNIFLVLFIISLVLAGGWTAGSIIDTDHFHFELARKISCVYSFLSDDFDDDGIVEWIPLSCERDGFVAYDVKDGEMITYYHLTRKEWIEDIFSVKLYEDGPPFVAMSLRNPGGDSAWVEIVDWNRKTFYKTDAIEGVNLNDRTKQYPGWDGYIDKLRVRDLDGDGRIEIIMTVHTKYDLRPRGVYVYDFPDGTLRWNYNTSGPVTNLLIDDIDGDNRAELLLGTWAPCNGNTAHGRVDTASYYILLDYLGNEIWWKNATDKFFNTNIALEDLDNDGQRELITSRATGKHGDRDAVVIFEKSHPLTGEIIRTYPDRVRNEAFKVGHLRNRPEKQIILSEPAAILDDNLKPISKIDMPGLSVKEILDINGDGIEEIIANKENHIYILDSLLKIRGRFEFPVNFSIYRGIKLIVDDQENRYLAALGGPMELRERPSLYLLKYLPEEDARVDLVSALKPDWKLMVILFLFGGSLTGVLLSSFGLIEKRTRAGKDESASLENLLTALTVFNHGQTASSNLNRLAFLFKNLPGDFGEIPEFRENLRQTIAAFNSYTVGHIKQINELSATVTIQREKRAMLARCSKELEQVVNQAEIDTIASEREIALSAKKEIPAAIDNFKKALKSVRSEVERHFQTDVIGVLKAVLIAKKHDFERNRIEAPEMIITGLPDGSAGIAPQQFSAVIEEMLTNAARAMENSNERRILIRTEFQEEYINIIITDTGAGIEKDDIPKIFERDFSTRGQGGGYGLYYIRETLNRAGGSISVTESQPLKGTTFLIKLRKI